MIEQIDQRQQEGGACEGLAFHLLTKKSYRSKEEANDPELAFTAPDGTSTPECRLPCWGRFRQMVHHFSEVYELAIGECEIAMVPRNSSVPHIKF
jgi:hypothetical protein